MYLQLDALLTYCQTTVVVRHIVGHKAGYKAGHDVQTWTHYQTQQGRILQVEAYYCPFSFKYALELQVIGETEVHCGLKA